MYLLDAGSEKTTPSLPCVQAGLGELPAKCVPQPDPHEKVPSQLCILCWDNDYSDLTARFANVKYEFQNSGPFHRSVPLDDCNLVFGTTLGQVKLRAAWARLLFLCWWPISKFQGHEKKLTTFALSCHPEVPGSLPGQVCTQVMGSCTWAPSTSLGPGWLSLVNGRYPLVPSIVPYTVWIYMEIATTNAAGIFTSIDVRIGRKSKRKKIQYI